MSSSGGERGLRVRGSWSRTTRGGADPWGDREGPRHPGAFRGPQLPVQISTVFRRIKKRQAFKKSINLTTCCPNAFRRLNFGELACLGRARVGLESHQLLQRWPRAPNSDYTRLMGLCQGLQTGSHWPPSASYGAARGVCVCVCAHACVHTCVHTCFAVTEGREMREPASLPSISSTSCKRAQGYLRSVVVTT